MNAPMIASLRYQRLAVLGSIQVVVLMIGALVWPTSSHAATTCVFTTSGTTMKLKADCTTDTTILVPNGFTFDGNKHTITAVDPGGDHFRGAVVKNAGATANVRNLTITTAGLADVCDEGNDRLRGILFEGAGGSIKKNTVRGLNQGASGCQEGNAIEVRNAPFDGTHPNTKSVTVEDNVLSAYQKTGVVANGDVAVKVEGNKITGLGPVPYIAQNGIQLGFGASGEVEDNRVSGNLYSPQTTTSCGILIVSVGQGVKVSDNNLSMNDIGVYLSGSTSGKVEDNTIRKSTFDGIALDDSLGATDGNNVEDNKNSLNGDGIGLYGANTKNNIIDDNDANMNGVGVILSSGVTMNTVSSNDAKSNSGDGIQVNGSGNTITRNTAKSNGSLDIRNTGSNTYTKNSCKTSSGPPIDCGALPTADAARAAANNVDAHPVTQPFAE